jgi:26S proteasome regulatory subunit N6
MSQVDSERVLEAQKLAKSDPRKAEEIYTDIISKTPSITSEAAIREYEQALVALGELYRDQRNTDALAALVTKSRTVLSSFAKAKTAKLSALPNISTSVKR